MIARQVRTVSVLVLAAMLILAASLVGQVASAARPAALGVGCMETTHCHVGTPGPGDDEQVHVDPRAMVLTGTPPSSGTPGWHITYSKFDSTTHELEAERHLPVDVDSLECCPGTSICTEGSGKVCTWAYQTQVMPIERYPWVRWYVTIDTGCEGHGCSTEVEWDVLTDVDAAGDDYTGTSPCGSGGEADFVVDVPH